MSNARPSARAALSIISLLGLVASLLVVLALTPAPASAATCSTSSTGGTVTRVLWVPGQGFRSYNLHVPSGLTGDTPLLIDAHGLGSNAFFQEVTSGWSQYADAEKFIVAYPAGSYWGQGWQINAGSPDVKFVRKVVDQIKGKYCVDEDRIFAEGGSMGGLMAQRLACDAEDVFASAVSTISGTYDILGSSCTLDRPVSMGVVNTEGDPLFPTSASIAARDAWLDLDGCETTGAAEPNAHGANARVYDCDDATQVLWRTYSGNSHSYPSGAALDDYHDRVWDFLMANPRP